jgi:hypothetical protein
LAKVQIISLQRAYKAKTRRFQIDEEEQLPLLSNQKRRRIIILALETAMRRGEIMNIIISLTTLRLFVLFKDFSKYLNIIINCYWR